jgi:RNA polymerase sigma factor (sigma-70 family)
MTRYNPDFWEVSVDPEILESVLIAPDMIEQLLAAPEDEHAAQERERIKGQALGLIRELIRTRLTPDQQRVIDLYFNQGKTQGEIAEELHISQQVVSKHLFGVLRAGRRVGGALRKLRKLCEQAGIDPRKWV